MRLSKINKSLINLEKIWILLLKIYALNLICFICIKSLTDGLNLTQDNFIHAHVCKKLHGKCIENFNYFYK